MEDQIADAWAAWIRGADPSADTSENGFRAGVEYALAALPRMQPSDAEVERAARAMAELSCKYPDPMKRHAWADVYWPAYSEYSRAALATLPALPTPDAAALRLPDINASGIIDEVCGEWAIETPQGFATALWDRLATALVTPSAQAEIDARRNEDAAALRAQGFAAGRDAAWTLADRMWPEAHDLLDAIAALRAPEPKEPT